jgi:tetratricopeptide (TPR) repeat protein
MPFRPRVNESISANSSNYTFTEHPSAPNMAYGQTGRRATVYQLRNLAGELYALKVFTKAWRDPRNATGARQLASFAHLPGLQVCNRSVFTPHSHADLIATYPDLDYAVLMAWVCGETWQEVLLNGQPLTVDQSRELGLAFLGILISMEQAGLAHCDLSGPNVLLQFSPPQAALVDLEDLFGPGLSKPDKLPGGSSGYGHKTALGGLWSADADRFAGAILLAEILGWCDERVRRISYGEQYFDPAEVQQSSERYQLLLCVLHEQWGDGVAHAFTRAWFSERLEDCPSFQEWDSLLNPAHPIEDLAIMEQRVQAKIDDAEEMLANDQHDQAVVSLEEAYQVSPKAAASTYARGLLTRGAAREREGDLQGALADYQMAFQIAPEGGLRDELKLILAELEPVAEPDEAAPVIFDTEVLETELVATIEPVPVEKGKVTNHPKSSSKKKLRLRNCLITGIILAVCVFTISVLVFFIIILPQQLVVAPSVQATNTPLPNAIITGSWVGSSVEVLGDNRNFQMYLTVDPIDSTSFDGDIKLYLNGELFQSNYLVEGSVKNIYFKFKDEDGRYYWGHRHSNSLTGYISWDCYGCTYWGTIELSK